MAAAKFLVLSRLSPFPGPVGLFNQAIWIKENTDDAMGEVCITLFSEEQQKNGTKVLYQWKSCFGFTVERC